MKKITVVIPSYNGERFIERCFQSLLNQTIGFKNLKVVVVVDGKSTDRTYEIYQELAKSHANLQVFRVDNPRGGPATPRATGLGKVKTKYVTCLDQDDWLEPDFCQTLYDEAEREGYDVVVSGWNRYDGATGQKLSPRKLRKGKYNYYNNSVVVAKLHRTAFLKKHRIVMQDTLGEDSLYAFKEYAAPGVKIGTTDYRGYNVCLNAESITHTTMKKLDKKNRSGYVKSFNLYFDVYDQNQLEAQGYMNLALMINYLLMYGRKVPETDFLNFFSDIIVLLDRRFHGWRKSKYLWLWPSGVWWLLGLSTNLFILIYRLKLIKLVAKIWVRI